MNNIRLCEGEECKNEVDGRRKFCDSCKIERRRVQNRRNARNSRSISKAPIPSASSTSTSSKSADNDSDSATSASLMPFGLMVNLLEGHKKELEAVLKDSIAVTDESAGIYFINIF